MKQIYTEDDDRGSPWGRKHEQSGLSTPLLLHLSSLEMPLQMSLCGLQSCYWISRRQFFGLTYSHMTVPQKVCGKMGLSLFWSKINFEIHA